MRIHRAAVLAMIALFPLILGCATAARRVRFDDAVRAEQSGDYARAAEVGRQVLSTSKNPDMRRRARLLLARLYVDHLSMPDAGYRLYSEVLDRYPTHRESAEAAWRLGRHAFDQGDFEGARRLLLGLILDMGGSPYDADARLWLAATYERLGDPSAAGDAYHAFVLRFANDPRADFARTRAAQLAAGTAGPPPDPQQLPASPRGRVSTVDDALPRRQPTTVDEARRLDDAPPRRFIGPPTRPNAREELASWGPSPIFGYNPRELMQAGGGLFGGRDLEESLAGDGANLDDALFALGMLYFQNRDYRRAGACLEQVAAMGVEEPDLFVALSVSYLRVGAVAEATEALAQAYRLDPDTFTRMVGFARSRIEEGERDLAETVARILSDLAPDRAGELDEIRSRLSK